VVERGRDNNTRRNLMGIEFSYSLEKDKMNCIKEEIAGKNVSEHLVRCGVEMGDLLAASQPRSIFNRREMTLYCFRARASLLRRAIVLPNSYELFLSPWLADGTFSYPHESIRRDWKEWFPSGHNARTETGSGLTINLLRDDAFDGVRCLLDKQPKYIVKNHADADNYWHWTFEWLPRLLKLRELASRDASLERIELIVLGSSLNSFQREWISLLLGESVVVQSYKNPILCENLLWITPPFPAHHDAKTIQEFRSTMLGDESKRSRLCQHQRESSKQIYLLRGKASNGRRIKNEKEIIEVVMRLGFTPMAMDGLSVAEQASIFSQADIIVGAHGSAFVNIIFCKVSCKVIELFGPGYISGHDYSLAYTCGLYWDYIEGVSDETSPSFTSDYYIEADKMARKISELLRHPKGFC